MIVFCLFACTWLSFNMTSLDMIWVELTWRIQRQQKIYQNLSLMNYSSALAACATQMKMTSIQTMKLSAINQNSNEFESGGGSCVCAPCSNDCFGFRPTISLWLSFTYGSLHGFCDLNLLAKRRRAKQLWTWHGIVQKHFPFHLIDWLDSCGISFSMIPKHH